MRIKKGRTLVVACCLGASAAFINSAALAQEGHPLAVVNGQTITQEQLLTYARVNAPQANLQDLNVRAQLLQTYIGRELMYQEAIKEKVDQQPQVQAVLEDTRHAVLSQAYVSQLKRSNPITEEMARKVYDQQIASRKGVEYQVRHILVPTEDEAKSAILRIRRGESFAKVAQMLSKDASAVRGGELGWVDPAKMPKPFADAIKRLKPGSFTNTPVKTEFGWHVIEVDANRPITPPPFESLRDQIMKAMEDQMIKQRLADLQKNAKIELIKGDK